MVLNEMVGIHTSKTHFTAQCIIII